MNRIRIVIAFCAAITVLAALATVSSGQAEKKLYTKMTGKEEKPTKGDPDGKGTAVLTLKATKVCYDIRPTKAGLTFTLGHIHLGKKGKAGGIFIPLFTKTKKVVGHTKPSTIKIGKLAGCSRKVSPADLAMVVAKPADYYLNIHTKQFRGGALRGQLTAKAPPPKPPVKAKP